MKLENQVCSLENAKKLAELGVTAESYFDWWNNGHKNKDVIIRKGGENMLNRSLENIAPAYTVAELLNMLQKWRNASMCELLLSEIDADYLCDLLIRVIESGELKAEDL